MRKLVLLLVFSIVPAIVVDRPPHIRRVRPVVAPAAAEKLPSSPIPSERTSYEVRREGERLRLDFHANPPVSIAFAPVRMAGVTERYVYEEKRVEQIFIVDEKPAGPLVVRSRVETSLTGPVIPVPRGRAGWNDMEMVNGGLWFTNERQEPVLAYYDAKAIDASGREIGLDPRWEAGEIVLEVPESFVAEASFPLTVDPWIGLGGSGSGVGLSVGLASTPDTPRVAIDGSGNPIVVWADYVSSYYNVFLKRWNGSAWKSMNGLADYDQVSSNASATDQAGMPTLALTSTGNPIVAWRQSSGATVYLYLKQWTGSAWKKMDGVTDGVEVITSAAGNSPNPSLRVYGSTPMIAWAEGTPTEIRFRKWSGSAWVQADGTTVGSDNVSNTGGDASDTPSLAITSSGIPMIAWKETPVGQQPEIYFKRWNGTSWLSMNGSSGFDNVSVTSVQSASPSLQVDVAGNPAIAWQETLSTTFQAINFRRWTGASWDQVGGSATGSGISPNNLSSSSPSLALTASGDPVVVWTSGATSLVVYLRRLSGTAWVEVGSSASGNGISGSGSSQSPFIALDASGTAFVAWRNSGLWVFLRRYEELASSALDQRRLDGTTPITVGGTTAEGAVLFRYVIQGEPTLFYELQVEVQPVGTAFTGLPTAASPFVLGGTATTLSLPLANGSYHWQAREVRSDLYPVSEWIAFGGNSESDADFVVSASQGSGTTCGLLGFEAPLLLALFALSLRTSGRPRKL